ncbi:hypothetical protein [Kitasatospora sp. NPDC057223]|uniref:hypothetical protein n=1 Tax=Kitasatospora sp. NPDC057223 TaxID=3346055 RepID=UPI00363DA4F5
MSEQTPAEQPDPATGEQARRALDGLPLLWVGPQCPPDWSSAGPRRTVADLLGHLDLSATCAYSKRENDQP